jgi:uncharacterized protein (TIGR02594 family)
MTELGSFRLPLKHAALALCSVAIVAIATPASARPSHGVSRHAHARHHHVAGHFGRHYRHYARHVRSQSVASASTSAVGGGFSDLVSEARRYIGGNPTGRRSLWCAAFMNMVLERSGHHGTGSNLARSFASYGHPVSGPQVGAIAVMSRRGGGHVGVVSGVDANGNVIVVSGNHGHRVAEAVYPRARIYAYVMPSS